MEVLHLSQTHLGIRSARPPVHNGLLQNAQLSVPRQGSRAQARKVPHTNHDVKAVPGIPWSRLGEPDQVHVWHSKIECGNQVDNCHHPKVHHSEGQIMR